MRPSFLTALTAEPPQWLTADGPLTEVVLSSRIRLARNLSGFFFPGRADAEQRCAIRDSIAALAADLFPGGSTHCVNLPETDEITRRVLAERHLISRELCAAPPGTALCLSPNHRLGALINEEDHIRLQGLKPGLDLVSLWQEVVAGDDCLRSELPLAFDRRWGFLTACPSNLGTGLRASAMMWLPALSLSGQMQRAIKGAQVLGLAVRGIFGEGTHALGHVFQVSNQSTLGETENGIIFRLEKVVRHLVKCEQAARVRLAGETDRRLPDMVGRAYGLLCYAQSITNPEALGALFAVRLGVVLNLFTSLSLETVDRLIVSVQPGHLRFEHADATNSRSRRQIRASVIRQALRQSGKD